MIKEKQAKPQGKLQPVDTAAATVAVAVVDDSHPCRVQA